ncbi:hypothetical protein [Bradyrhizobium arachidis]|uniref:hypothetical protein n=1 Tax=Bradyrhizobium arachidis TaxID=858423 RepID=UPI002162CF5E|nr:hypothetical protein [Bradyrhizobium arachidis]UVO30619.1 hypothetical protein KUF59_08140 [Bradyrhizobium arachidis]
MALGADEIADIEQELGSFDDVSQAYAALRQRYPHLSWIRCDASDLTEIPFCSIRQFDLHLLDSADHCARITDDPTRATGIVLAKRAAEL